MCMVYMLVQKTPAASSVLQSYRVVHKNHGLRLINNNNSKNNNKINNINNKHFRARSQYVHHAWCTHCDIFGVCVKRVIFK